MKKYLSILLILVTASSFALFEIDENKALLQDEKNTISIFKDSVQSVVHIATIGKVRRRGLFFYGGTQEVVRGEGTGFVFDKRGYIVTNYHVIEGGSKFMVKFHQDKKKYKAKLVGHERNKDIAILKLIDMPKNLKALKLGNSKEIQVGQKALAIGNPFGLDSTITQGIISATGRSIRGIGGIEIFDMIQTDSSINPGNSGGPLFNSRGEVIGVNTMIFSNSGSSAGVGFSVPINVVKKIAPQIIKYGSIKRAGLGITPAERAYLAYYFEIDLEKGLPIATVLNDSPADKAGLRGMTEDNQGRVYLGDIILKIDDKDVNSFDDIYNILFEYKIGDTVDVTYQRDGKTKKTKLKLMELNK